MFGVLFVRLLNINLIEFCSGKLGLPSLLLSCGLVGLFAMMAAWAGRIVLHVLDQANINYLSIHKAIACQVASVDVLVDTAKREVSDDEWRVVPTMLMSSLKREARVVVMLAMSMELVLKLLLAVVVCLMVSQLCLLHLGIRDISDIRRQELNFVAMMSTTLDLVGWKSQVMLALKLVLLLVLSVMLLIIVHHTIC